MMMGGYTYDGAGDSCGLVYNEYLVLMFETVD